MNNITIPEKISKPVSTLYGVLMPHNNLVSMAVIHRVTEKPTCIEKRDWLMHKDYKLYFVDSVGDTFTIAQIKKRKITILPLVHVLVLDMYWVLGPPVNIEDLLPKLKGGEVTFNPEINQVIDRFTKTTDRDAEALENSLVES